MAVLIFVLTLVPLYFTSKKLLAQDCQNCCDGTENENESGTYSCEEHTNVNADDNRKIDKLRKIKSMGSETDITESTLRSRFSTFSTFHTLGSMDFDETQHNITESTLDSMDFDETLHGIEKNIDEMENTGLGCKLKEDESPVTVDSNASSPPPDLEHVVAFQLPVGYFRLRKAMLGRSSFWEDEVIAKSLRNTRISRDKWSQHHQHIGNPTPPDPSTNITESDFLNRTRETSYLMPDTAILKATMAYETATLTHYTPQAFTITMKTLTPTVPFGSKFVNRTQFTVTNNFTTQGGQINTCQLTCSCEVDFPNGPIPMIGSQIQRQSRLGSMDSFHKVEEAIRLAIDKEEAICSNHSEGDAASLVYDLSLPVGGRKVGQGDGEVPVLFSGCGFINLEENSMVVSKKKKGALQRMRRWSKRKSFTNKMKRDKRKEKKKTNEDGRRRTRSDTDFSEITTTLFT